MNLDFPAEEKFDGVSAIFHNLAEAWRFEDYRVINEFERQLRQASFEEFHNYRGTKLELAVEDRYESQDDLINYCVAAAGRITRHADDQGHHLMHESALNGGEEDVVYVHNVFDFSENFGSEAMDSDSAHEVEAFDKGDEIDFLISGSSELSDFLDTGSSELSTSGQLSIFLSRLDSVKNPRELEALFDAIQEIERPSDRSAAADAWTRKSDDVSAFKKPHMLQRKRERQEK